MNREINILIADDQKLFRGAMVSLLKDFNIFTIGEAANGEELFELLKNKTPDVILLDIEMPGMDGGEILKALMDKKPSMKIIILSQYDEEVLKENYIARGAKAYLTKNADIETVISTIEKVAFGFCNEVCNSKSLYTKRELEIIPMICSGMSTKEIATALNLEIKSVEAHRKRIYKKTGVISIGQFLNIAFARGMNYLNANNSLSPQSHEKAK